MASAPAKKEFLCILPDKPGVVEKRLEVRGAHLENVKPLVEQGSVVIGGATFDHHPTGGETPAFNGSMLIVVVENEEQVWEILKNDVYVKNGVWDLERAQIIPFKSAVRTAL
ncbi:hypothetical protein ASPWEDRAFT_47814 [Aspergillus wentii DTO 134E9]|uniref:YCII-related domain-containing protein n=1 Tax=Aspergillus wentii DTO 134E9 TaxID=1073089 RepID=A0A1L9S1Z8_ASPWE|nr:uncharacterized protein ASPWEDRAFT_47814 [Aspergillus wentii DTO 134E9]KAI9930839.1 hypothetical protein MW887_010489 [Aspergillus wentii]OJJ41175.1 hypothetical protein ASPWEDRAFT_47814 [Aspergillus wentii DTO 134E9]